MTNRHPGPDRGPHEPGEEDTLEVSLDVELTPTGDPPPFWPPALSPGEEVADRFEVIRFIASGGMGEVYEVEDLDLGERVALKMLRPDLARDPGAVQRLKREIQLAHRVTHPNVCRIFDAVRHRRPHGERLGYTMELLAGETLARRLLRQGRLGVDEALPLVRQMAAGLDAAHQAGVIHRDFKSSNVMLVPRGDGDRAVITDFGVARPTPDREYDTPPLTSDDLTLGTADYMAPEQAQGGPITPAADIYAFGVVLFEMMTGERPHRGETPVALLLERLKEPPPSPKGLVAGLPAHWDQTIRICLARDRGQRFHSAGAVVAALERTDPRPTATFTLDTGEVRARRWQVWGAAVAMAMVVGGLAWWSRDRPLAVPVAVLPQTSQLTTWPSLEVDPCFSPGGRAIVFSSNRTGRFEIYSKQLTPGSREVRLTSDGQQNFQPSWSPDGALIAYASHGRGGIWLVPATGGKPHQLTVFGSHPAWSPDGSEVAFQSDATAELSAHAAHAMPPSTLWLVPVAGGAPQPLTRPGEPSGGHGAPQWSPDGRRIVFTASDRRSSHVWVVDRTGDGLAVLVTEPQECFDPRFCPDRRHVFYSAIAAGERYGVWRLPVTEAGRVSGPAEPVAGLALASIRQYDIASDGGRMVHTALATTSNLWALPMSAEAHLPNGEPRPLTTGSARNSRPAFSPDGDRIAFDRWHVGTREDIWIMAADGRGVIQQTLLPAADTQASWYPGADRIAFLSDRGGTWGLWAADLASGVEVLVADLGDAVDAVRLSPDGEHIVYHRRAAGAVNLWVASADGSHARQLTDDDELMGYPCWSPDGSTLAFEAKRGDDDHILVMAASGGPPRQLTDAPGKSWPYSFSPDGDKIAFVALRDGFWNLWWVSLSTGEARQLTRFESLTAYVRYPAWSPRGDQIVFEYAENTGDLWLLEGAF